MRGRREEAGAQHNEQEIRKGEREERGGRRTAQRAEEPRIKKKT